MFFWRFHFENEIPVNFLFIPWKWRYILNFGPWRWSATWDLWISGLQECKGNGFSKVGRARTNFWSGPKNLDILNKQLPLPESTSPKKFNVLQTFVFTSNKIKVKNKFNIFSRIFFPNMVQNDFRPYFPLGNYNEYWKWSIWVDIPLNHLSWFQLLVTLRWSLMC